MDPAVVVASAVACSSLAAWLLFSLPSLGRAVVGVRVPVGLMAGRMAGPMAGVLAGSLLLLVVRERPARAATPPPVVRLGAAVPGPNPVDPPNIESHAEYVVVTGDSLWAIARRHLEAATEEEPSSSEVDRLWRAIYAENRRVVGDDPNLILPGQRLRLPEG